MSESERIEAAIALAVEYGGIDGSHHKAWVIDQMVRALCGCHAKTVGGKRTNGEEWSFTSYLTNDQYEKLVAIAKHGEDGPDTYEWDEGIAP